MYKNMWGQLYVKVPHPLPKTLWPSSSTFLQSSCVIIIIMWVIKNVTCYFSPLAAVRPNFTEMVTLGAAIAAGLAVNVWKDISKLPAINFTFKEPKKADGT